MQRAILHIDMDAFYASVEQRDFPELRGKPIIVGGDPRRGVVLAASYEVRPFGVRSAIPMARALKLAPQAIVQRPRFEAYAEASDAIFSIFESVTPLVEPLSLDEAFIDVTGSTSLFGSPWAIATMLRERIAKEVRLPCTAGIAAVKFVAKMASDHGKPNGQFEVPSGRERDFLAPLPVSRLWGVGSKMEEQLKACGLPTIGSIAARGERFMEERFGQTGLQLWRLSQGIDERRVLPDREAKSVGAEDTFEHDLRSDEALRPHLHSQALRVGRRLRRAKMRARVVQLKIKYSDFEAITRRRTLEEPTDDGQTLYREALALLGRVARDKAIRLTGVSAQELTGAGEANPMGAPAQLSLFGAERSKDEGAVREAKARAAKLNGVLDRIEARFGRGAITTADLAAEPDADREDMDDVRRRAGASKLDARKP